MISTSEVLAAALLTLATVVACDKGDATSTKPATSASSPVASGSANAPAASAAASGAPSASGATTWSGTYEATEATMHVPEGKEWAGVKFRGDKSDVGLGKGTLKVDSDAKGNLLGTIDGPLGPGIVTGSVDKTGTVSARIDPKTPSDTAFYGTLLGKQEGAAIEATMRLSQAEAKVIREAKVSLKK